MRKLSRRPTGPWLVSAFAAWSTFGCVQGADSFGTVPSQPTDGLARELAAHLSLQSLLVYSLAVGAVFAFLLGVRVLVALLRRTGLGTERRLSLVAPVARGLSIVAFGVWVITRWSHSTPQLLVVSFPFLVGGCLWLVSGPIRSLASGVVLSLSRQIRVGDRITLDSLHGVVSEVGLIRSVLRRADGSLAHLPNQKLLANIVTVERQRNTEPLSVSVPFGDADPAELLIWGRSLVMLCPYRCLETEATAYVSSDLQHLVVSLHTWNAEAAELAYEVLHEALERHVRKLSEETAAADG